MVILILCSPIFITDGYVIDIFNDQSLVVDEDNHNRDVINKAEQLLTNAPQAFTANHGQLENDEVLFYDQRGAVWFTTDGMWMELREYDETRGLGSEARGLGGVRDELLITSPEFRVQSLESRSTISEYRRVVLKQEFEGANEVVPVGRERLSWNSNYFYGNDSLKWCTDVPNYAEVYYENIYDGIDLRYYTKKNGLKYDFIVHPGADPGQIMIRYEGAEAIEINDFGNLIVKTPLENILDGGLYIYQNIIGTQCPIKGKFNIIGNLNYSFEILDEFDHQESLIIDPRVQLEFSSYIGGNNWDMVNEIALDSELNIFVTGKTNSSNFPNTTGAFNEYLTGSEDIFVFKLNSNGSTPIYSTYVGGSNNDNGNGIAIDSNGNACISGKTGSFDFPIKSGSFDTIFNGISDCFILKLNQVGSDLDYSTFIGGIGYEIASGIAIDPFGNAFINGITNSTDFPTTTNAYDISYNGGLYDVFTLKLNQIGSDLIYSTYVGGSSIENMFGFEDLAIDSSGNVIVTGSTNSSDFPTTINAYDTSYNGGLYDVFVFKLNTNGSSLIFSTFIGGSGIDEGFGVVTDTLDNIIVTGRTTSADFPSTPGAFDTSFNGVHDAFVLKLNQNGSTLIFSTFVGGSDVEEGFDLALDCIGNIFLTGETKSPDFNTTPDAFDRIFNGTVQIPDGFLVKLNQNCSNLLYSTFIGGEKGDLGFSIAVDYKGHAYIGGMTDSSDFPTTPGIFDPSFNGEEDGFVLKVYFPPVVNITSLTLLKDNEPTTLVYSRLCNYTFVVNIIDTASLSELRNVGLNLDPAGTNIQILWDRNLNSFFEIMDPSNYITLKSTSRVYNNSRNNWTLYFNVSFNWTYPNEDFQNVQAYATSATVSASWFNVTGLYRVENDLEFNGILSVKGENNREILNKSLIRGNEQLTWTGLFPVYENTTEIYPPADEFDITIWDEDGNHWLDSPESSQQMNISTITSMRTSNNFNYTINLTVIPPECDKTSCTFSIRIDGDNVTFSNPWPNEYAWQKSAEVYTGITITDHGGGFVDNTSIMHSISEDNGTTWTDWNSTEFTGVSKSIKVHDFVAFADGIVNLIKWRAKDSLGNGPAESVPYRILVDTQPVYFTNSIPLPTHESSTGDVEVGITIIDNTSGVNASTIKYSISTDAGNDWSSWKTVTGFQNGNNVDVKLNLTFPNGTGNRIRWRAYDVAGNGPAYSEEYVINVNIPMPPIIIIPEIQLVSPINNSKLTTTPVKLTWEVINNYQPNIVFDIKLGIKNPPQDSIKQNYTESNIIINDLLHGQTYYWTVIPRLNNINGTCVSGIWSFTIELPLPKVTLLTPANGLMITSTRPTLTWDLEYTGSNMVEYDIYFGTDMDPVIYQDNITTKYFSIDYTLEDNTTYYWYVEPWADALRGYRSSVWSFTVKLRQDDKIPMFGIELALDPNPLEIKPGEVKFVSAIVTNLGELNDNFTIYIGNINGTDLTVEVYRQDTMEIASGKNKEFLIMISVEKGTEPGFENITIEAESKLAEKYNLNVRNSQVLSIKILEKDDQKEKERGQPISIFYFSILLLIIILIIISIIIMILVRKKSSKKDSMVKEIQDIIPETIPTPEPEPTLELVPPMTVSMPIQRLEENQAIQQNEQEE